MEWLREQWRQIRGHVKYEAIKWLVLAVISGGIASAYVLLQKIRGLSWDWWVFGGIFLLALVALILTGLKSSRKHVQGTPLDARPVEQVLEEIRFDYLPGDPLSHGWILAYEDPGDPPRFTTPGWGGLSVQVDRKFAMDYAIPAHAILADRIVFSIKFCDSTMFFTKLSVGSIDGSTHKDQWIKYYVGNQPPEQTAGYPWETTLWAKPKAIANGWVTFDLDLRDVVRTTIGSEGWIYNSLKAVRLRGSLSISPISLYSRDAGGSP